MSPPGAVVILGAGGWGTALALLAARNGHPTRLWAHDPPYAQFLDRQRSNPKFLPGVEIPRSIAISSRADELLPGAGIIFSVVPTQFLRASLAAARASLAADLPADLPVVSCSKGLERSTLRLPSQIILEELGPRPLVVLSGPSHAEEVARGLPASVVVASREPLASRRTAEILGGPSFRIYTSPDTMGVEVGGAAKNVIALASGIAAGLGLGDNAQAALITRGSIEVSRLGVALGARRETFGGLTGIGDLIATCTSPHSRNRSVGLRIGSGETLDVILRSTEKVPEGVETARSLHHLSRNLGLELPITRQVHAVLFEEKPPRLAVQDLMSRSSKDEFEDLI